MEHDPARFCSGQVPSQVQAASHEVDKLLGTSRMRCGRRVMVGCVTARAKPAEDFAKLHPAQADSIAVGPPKREIV